MKKNKEKYRTHLFFNLLFLFLILQMMACGGRGFKTSKDIKDDSSFDESADFSDTDLDDFEDFEKEEDDGLAEEVAETEDVDSDLTITEDDDESSASQEFEELEDELAEVDKDVKEEKSLETSATDSESKTVDSEMGEIEDEDLLKGERSEGEEEFSKQASVSKEETSDQDLGTDDEISEDPSLEDSFQEISEIKNIKYENNQEGGTIAIETSDEIQYNSFTDEINKQFILEFASANVPLELEKFYPIKAKSKKTAFTSFKVERNVDTSTVRIVINMKSLQEPVIQRQGNTLLIHSPLGEGSIDMQLAENEKGEDFDDMQFSKNEKEKEKSIDKKVKQEKPIDRKKTILKAKTLEDFLLSGERHYYGKKLSIEVKDADIRDVFQFITMKSGINMVLSDDVQGRVSLKLKRVPWDQALIILMRIKNLAYIRYGNVLQISSYNVIKRELDRIKDQIKKEEEEKQREEKSKRALLVSDEEQVKDSFEEEKTKEEEIPLIVKVLPVNFSKAAVMVNKMGDFLTPGKGKISSHERTNSLIIRDTQSAIEKISSILRALDTPPPQVLIEGRFVEVSKSFSREMGINLGLQPFDYNLSPESASNPNPIKVGGNLHIQPVDRKVAEGGVIATSLTFKTLKYFGDLDAKLSLAESENIAEVISSPKIITMNNEEAIIRQKGEDIVISKVRLDNSATQDVVSRSPIILELRVQPQITSNRSVSMTVKITREFPGAKVPGDVEARPINSREASTKILIKDGHTAVIGGVYQRDTTESETGVPWLRHLPIFGWLFKSISKGFNKNQLIIFLTPKIVDHGTDDDSGDDSIEDFDKFALNQEEL